MIARKSASSDDSDVERVTICVQQLRRAVPGGIGTYAKGLVNGLTKLPGDERPDISLFASRPTEQPDPLEHFGLEVQTSRMPEPFASRLWGLGLGRAAAEGDLFHSTALGYPPTKSRLVVTIHDLAWRTLPRLFSSHGVRWHEAAFQRATKHAEHFVVPSNDVAIALLAAGRGVGEDRVTVIEHGADHLPPPDDEATNRLLEDRGVRGTFLLAVGTLEPRKNLARLVAAYSSIRSRLPEPWPLVVVGPKGWGEGIEAPDGDVILVGSVSDGVLAGLYRRAHLVAYVPLLEGFGLPVVEALHAGTPVVSSGVPAAKEATQLCDPESIESIADALLVVALENQRRQELVKLAEARVEHLTWRESATKHVRLWQELS